jgi:hypothetical protein
MPQPYEAVIDRVAQAAGTRSMPPAEAEALLVLARRVAHSSDDRRSAPLVCALVGEALAGIDDPAARLARIGAITALFPHHD